MRYDLQQNANSLPIHDLGGDTFYVAFEKIMIYVF